MSKADLYSGTSIGTWHMLDLGSGPVCYEQRIDGQPTGMHFFVARWRNRTIRALVKGSALSAHRPHRPRRAGAHGGRVPLDVQRRGWAGMTRPRRVIDHPKMAAMTFVGAFIRIVGRGYVDVDQLVAGAESSFGGLRGVRSQGTRRSASRPSSGSSKR